MELNHVYNSRFYKVNKSTTKDRYATRSPIVTMSDFCGKPPGVAIFDSVLCVFHLTFCLVKQTHLPPIN